MNMWTVVLRTAREHPFSVRADTCEDAVAQAKAIFERKYPTKHSQRRVRPVKVLQVVNWDREKISV